MSLKYQHWAGRALVIIASLFIITSYQNCASPAENSLYAGEDFTADGCPVAEPNCLSSTDSLGAGTNMWFTLAAGSTLTVAYPSNVLEVRGDCYVPEGHKSSITWTLYKPNTTELRQTGVLADVACVSGHVAFDIELINTTSDPFNFSANHKFHIELTSTDADGVVHRNSLLSSVDAWVNGGQ